MTASGEESLSRDGLPIGPVRAATRPVTIELLNHASILLSEGTVSMLTDPWYSGTAFRGAWGLRFDNPTALARAQTATHLWISHFHSDHFHLPTLRALAATRPDLVALANDSANFSLEGPLRAVGFREVRTLPERSAHHLTPGWEVTRFPATGIDNMLVVRVAGLTILNFNDCNLPVRAIRALVRRIGAVEILLINYNHAGKLFGRPSPAAVKEGQLRRFGTAVEAVCPRWVVPFASAHYYRAPASAEQNLSLLDAEELAGAAPGVVPLRVGDGAAFGRGVEPLRSMRRPALEPVSPQAIRHDTSLPWEELVAAAERYRIRIGRGFGPLVRWVDRLALHVDDHHRVLVMELARGVWEGAAGTPVDASAHSRSLATWFDKAYGTDDFFVGGDFSMPEGEAVALERLKLLGLLIENRLSPRDIAMMLLSPSGWRFFLNRREEILAILLARKIRAVEPRL
jgi:hypothetical protein